MVQMNLKNNASSFVLETERLILRKFIPDDLEELKKSCRILK